MPNQRQPVELIIANGKKHLTKAEIEDRKNREVRPLEGEILPPAYLTAKQKKEFLKIAGQLQRLKVMSETDVDSLARYIISETFYLQIVKKMRSREVKDDPELYESWLKIQERLYRQCQSGARDLGLTISSRCRLVIPDPGDKEEKQNKFRRFEKRPTA